MVFNFLKKSSLLLTISIGLLFFIPSLVSAISINTSDLETHYRIEIKEQRKELSISKVAGKIRLNGEKKLIDHLFNWFRSGKYSKRYIKGVSISKAGEIEINPSNGSVEAFSFLRSNNRTLVLDFWENEKEKITKKKISLIKTDVVKKKLSAPKKRKEKRNKVKQKKNTDRGYKDYRYGLTYVWDYEPLFPTFKKFVNIKRKTPMHFYKLKDRLYEKSEQEAHMQLTINLFRKDKWGLMNKSIELYNKKYGQDNNESLNELLRVTALIKNNYLNGETTPQKGIIKRLEELELISNDFNISKSVLKYVFQYYLETNDYISSLKIGKRLFVLTKEDYDTEGLVESLHGIIFSLSKLNQYDKITLLLEDKEVEKYLEKVKIAEYKIFNNLYNKNYDQVVNIYNQLEPAMIEKMPASIVFNVSEAYFRLGNYEKSAKMFDSFVAHYSYEKKSAEARLRIALSYDLINENEKKVSRMYRDVINRSADPYVRYEASLRFFGMDFLRNDKSRNDESIIFINPPEEITSSLTKELLKSKWQLRLRSLIVQGKYGQALNYLKNIKIDDMPKEERISFKKDGAAALTYEMERLFKEGKFSELIKLHELSNNSVTDPSTYFIKRNEILGMSYLKMNLYSPYRKILDKIKQRNKNYDQKFPVWKKMISTNDKEISLLKLFHLNNLKKKNSKLALEDCRDMKKISSIESAYCFAETEFLIGDLKSAKKNLEKLISEHQSELRDTARNSEISYMYLMSLYKLRYFDKFIEIVTAVSKSKSLDEFPSQKNEEINYLFFETVYASKNELITKSHIDKMNKFITSYPNSKWNDRVRFLKASSLIKIGKREDGKKELNSLISTTKKEYLKDLARSELASLVLNNKI